MAGDWQYPDETRHYINQFVPELRQRDLDAVTMLEDLTGAANLPTNAKRWNQAAARFERYNGTSWEQLAGLFEMKVRDSDRLNGQAEAFYRNAGNINAGTLPGARFADSSHGTRGGGTLHALATALAAGFMSAAHFSKLEGIETGATADQTAAEILALLRTVAGPGSALDADTLDGQHLAWILDRANHTGAGGGYKALRVYAGSAVWTKPEGLLAAEVLVVGGGGSGTPYFDFGAWRNPVGHAGGAAIKYLEAAVLGATEVVTVPGRSTSGAGGTASFGAHCSATGGGNTAQISSGPGVGIGGDLNIYGGGISYTGSVYLAGASIFGGPPPADVPGFAQDGVAPGAGGQGRQAGGPAVVLVRESF
jgi:hypothetical protein